MRTLYRLIGIKHSGHNHAERRAFLYAREFGVRYDDREMIYAVRQT